MENPTPTPTPNPSPAKMSPWNRFGKPVLVMVAAYLLATLHMATLPRGEDGGWMVIGEFMFVFPTAIVVSAIGAVFGRGTKVGSFFMMAILFVICFAATILFSGK